jgi:excisionase family DNA binding protein
MSVDEIAKRLAIGRLAVYAMLQHGIIPGIRLGRRWIVTGYAYEQWERTAGMYDSTGLRARTEVTVVN